MTEKQRKRLAREDRILLRLNKLNFATRRQLQIIEELGGDRNAQRLLRRMEKDRTLSAIRREQKIFYLSNRGKERIGSNQSKLERNKIKHTIMLNDLYIKLGMPSDWKTEAVIRADDKTLLISDALYRKGSDNFVFIEIDNVQTMRSNYDKIKRYKDLSRRIYSQHKTHLLLIWYTLSGTRRDKLAKACEKEGVKYRIMGGDEIV